MEASSAEAYARAADELREAATAHKRSAAFHKSKARAAMAARQNIIEEAERLGLTLEITTAKPKEAKRND